MQVKREKLNNSAIIESSAQANGMTVSTNQSSTGNKRRTPTSMVLGQSNDSMAPVTNFATPNQVTGKAQQRQSKDKNLNKINHQAILNQHLQDLPVGASMVNAGGVQMMSNFGPGG